MEKITVSNDIVPVGEFKAKVSQCLKNVQATGHPLIITQNGRPAGVLVSPAEYDNLVHTKLFIDSVSRGIEDADSGRVFDTNKLRRELKKRRSLRTGE